MRKVVKNITKEHILKSIERIDEEGYPKKRKSKGFELVYKERCYPPKYVIALAGFFANQYFISHREFSGGEYYNQFLKNLGFEVLTKKEAETYPQAKEHEKNIHYKYTYQKAEILEKDKFKKYFEFYIDHCKNSDWFQNDEAYKFRFGRWLSEKVDFEKQTDEEILQICIDSQNEDFGHAQKGGLPPKNWTAV